MSTARMWKYYILSPNSEDILLRQGDEFVDALRLKTASSMANPATATTYDYRLAADDACDPAKPSATQRAPTNAWPR